MADNRTPHNVTYSDLHSALNAPEGLEHDGTPSKRSTPPRRTQRRTTQVWVAGVAAVMTLCALTGVGIYFGTSPSKLEEYHAPGHFTLSSTATGPRTVEIEVSVPDIKNGALDRCYGTLLGGGKERNFTCGDHGGKSSTIKIRRLLPGTAYKCTVTFANVFDGREMATSETTYVRTMDDLPPPKNITILAKSPSRSKLVWEPPSIVSGTLAGYTVKICDGFGSCSAEAEEGGCKEFITSVASVEFETTVDTSYCVQVVANVNHGSRVHSSLPALADVRTPTYAPGHFALWSAATGPMAVEIEVSVPSIKNGALDRCYGTLQGGGIERRFTCDDHGGKSSKIMIRALLPGTVYNCTVTFANVFGGREMAISESTHVSTTGESLDVPRGYQT